jgi:hypothetical protein
VAPRLRRALGRDEAFARCGRGGFVAVGPGIPQLRDGQSRPRPPGPPAGACLPATAKPLQTRTLTDGTKKLVVLRRRRPADEEELRTGELTSVTVRMIRYTLEDPDRPGHRIEHRLITSLLDPDLAPARQIVVAYHARWEFELAVDEINTHQRPPQKPLRSERPVGVIQEAYYELLVAHYVVRAVMTEAARTVELPPGRRLASPTRCASFERWYRKLNAPPQRTMRAFTDSSCPTCPRRPCPREPIAAIHASSNARCPSSGSKPQAIAPGLNRPNLSTKRSFSLSKPYCP